MIKKIVSLLIVFGLLWFSPNGAPSKKEIVKNNNIQSKKVQHINVSPDLNYVYNYELGDYDSFNFYSKSGNPIECYVEGTTFGLRSSSTLSDVEFEIYSFDFEDNRYDFVEDFNSVNSFDCSELLSEGIPYFVDIYFTVEGVNYYYEDVSITMDSSRLSFVAPCSYTNSSVSDSELWTDQASLEECLSPQNDIQSDHPFIISEAQRIVSEAGAVTDYEKAFAIYMFIVNEFYYDYDQIYNSQGVSFQDDAVTLMRSKIAVCEGFSNVFVALCRSLSIPSSVCYGISMFSYENLLGYTYSDYGDNHAWASVYLGDRWYFLDPTIDVKGAHLDGEKTSEECDYLSAWLIPLEFLSVTRLLRDADTYHSLEYSGYCGDSATYEISRDGTLTISGSGTIKLPDRESYFRRVVFAPDSNITGIGDFCFFDNDLLESVILPPTVTSIGEYAFSSCEDLDYVFLPESVTEIKEAAFYFCDELAFIYVPNSVEDLGYCCFDECPRLVLSVPSGALSMQDYDILPYKIITRDS